MTESISAADQPSPLISADELRRRLEAPADLVLLDCRYRLGDATAGPLAYQAGHLPGARYVPLEWDLATPPTATTTDHPGRHPLPSATDWCSTLGRLGISQDHLVVVYDQQGAAMAARAWWMLDAIGHRQCQVLDGGLDAYTAAGGSLSTAPAAITPLPPFPGQFDATRLASYQQVASADADGAVLIDAREAARFRGEVEPIDPVKGRIPGARNAPFVANLDESGRFLPPSVLRHRFETLLAGRPATAAISYCGSSVTACHNLLAMAVAGLPGGRLFVPSWSGWCRSAGRAVASGSGDQDGSAT